MNWKQFAIAAMTVVLVALLGAGTLWVVNNALQRPADASTSAQQPITVTVVMPTPAASTGNTAPVDPPSAAAAPVTNSNSSNQNVTVMVVNGQSVDPRCVPAKADEGYKALPAWCLTSAPAAAATATVTAPVTVTNTNTTDVIPACVDDPTMYSMTGIPAAINTSAPGDAEYGKWNFMFQAPITVTLPSDGLLTAKMADGSHVLWVGPATVTNVNEGTLRLGRCNPSNYWQNQGATAFVTHELGYSDMLRKQTKGVDNIVYMAGNITDARLDTYVPTAVTSTSWACPINASNVTSILGGTGTWKQSPDKPEQWVYTGQGWKDGKTLSFPGYGWYEYWKNAGEQLFKSIPDDNATFHCVAP